MPLTYTPTEAMTLTAAFVKNAPTSAMQVIAADAVSSQMWTAWPWEWTLQPISPAIPLVNLQQDYSSPAELYRMQNAWITQTDTTPNNTWDLDLAEWLPVWGLAATSVGSFKKYCHELTAGVLRLEGAPSVTGTQTFTLNGEYQANPAKITALTLGTPLWFPDQYFPVYCEGLLYYYYKFTDDQRAGTMQVTRQQQVVYTGQYGVWMNALQLMKQAEDLKQGDGFMWPQDTLGAGSQRGLSIFGN